MMKNATVKMAVKSKEKMPTAAMPSAGKGRVPVVPQGYGNGGTVYPTQGMKNGGKMAAFEKSGKDVEKKGMKEGSKADMAMDKKQMMAAGKSAGKK